LRGRGFAAKAFAEIDAAVLAERRDRVASRGVQSVNEVHHTGKYAFVVAITPISQAAIWLGPTNARVKFPEKFSRGGVQGKNFLGGSDAV